MNELNVVDPTTTWMHIVALLTAAADGPPKRGTVGPDLHSLPGPRRPDRRVEGTCAAARRRRRRPVCRDHRVRPPRLRSRRQRPPPNPNDGRPQAADRRRRARRPSGWIS